MLSFDSSNIPKKTKNNSNNFNEQPKSTRDSSTSPINYQVPVHKPNGSETSSSGSSSSESEEQESQTRKTQTNDKSKSDETERTSGLTPKPKNTYWKTWYNERGGREKVAQRRNVQKKIPQKNTFQNTDEVNPEELYEKRKEKWLQTKEKLKQKKRKWKERYDKIKQEQKVLKNNQEEAQRYYVDAWGNTIYY